MVRHLNILLLLFISSVAFGQTDRATQKIRKNSIRLGVGLIHVRMIDEGYTNSRLLFRGTNCKFGLGYGRETEKYSFIFSVTGSIGKVESESGNLPSDYFLFLPALEFSRNVSKYKLLGNESKLFLGANLSSFNQGIDNERAVNNISIYSLHGLYLSINNRILLNERQQLQLTYLMPAVIFENRVLWNGGASKYTYRDTENIARLLTNSGEFSYFNLRNNVQLGVDYIVKIGNASHVRFGYKFFRAISSLEAPFHLYSNELMVELKIGL
jgi:hypothetical protein